MAGYLGAGVVEGYNSTQIDLQQIQLNQDRLAMDPVKLQQEQISLQKDKIDLAQNIKMLSLMQNLKPPKDVNDPNQLAQVWTDMSMIQLESGKPDAAAKSASVASKIAEDASKIDSRTYRMQTDRMSKFANILAGSPDTQAGFTQALQSMLAEDPGVARDPKFQNLAKQGWRPGLVPLLERSVLTAKEQAEVSYRQKATEHAAVDVVLDKHRIDLVDAQAAEQRRLARQQKKEGGTVVKQSQLQAMTDLINRDYAGAVTEDVRVRARPLAEEAVQLMKTAHLTESEAMMRVYEKARTSGTFSGLRVAPTQKGTKPGKALPAPKDPSKVQLNQWYTGADGIPRLAVGPNKFLSEEQLAKIDAEDDETEDRDDEDE
jgi:hypothetical protein